MFYLLSKHTVETFPGLISLTYKIVPASRWQNSPSINQISIIYLTDFFQHPCKHPLISLRENTLRLSYRDFLFCKSCIISYLPAFFFPTKWLLNQLYLKAFACRFSIEISLLLLPLLLEQAWYVLQGSTLSLLEHVVESSFFKLHTHIHT